MDTHTRELDAAVTALGSSALLLDVLVAESTAGGLDDADAVGPCVVPVSIHQYRFEHIRCRLEARRIVAMLIVI
jgi:hypothetical protein